MRVICSLIAISLFAVGSSAQSRIITKDEYDRAHSFASTETNAAFPFVFTVITEIFHKGKLVSSVTDIYERESQARERVTRTIIDGVRTTKKYQVRVGFGNVFCSDDGLSWKPPSPYNCFGPVSVYGRREPESVEYSVTEEIRDGGVVSVYRQYSVFAPSKEKGKAEFWESVSTIDSRGFYMTVVHTEGTLNPRDVTLIRKQIWDTKTKIKPVVPPIE